MVALKLQQFQYTKRKFFSGARYFLRFFVKMTPPLWKRGGGATLFGYFWALPAFLIGWEWGWREGPNTYADPPPWRVITSTTPGG